MTLKRLAGGFLILSVILILPFFLPRRARGGGLTVTMPEKLVPYGDNEILVQSPEDGTLEITFSDPYAVYEPAEFEVRAGENRLKYDGLTPEGRRMGAPGQMLRFAAVLKEGQDEKMRFEGTVRNGKDRQVLYFALPSGPVLYRGGGDWFVELQTSRCENGDRICMEVRKDGSGEKIFEKWISILRDTPFLYRWSGETPEKVPAGVYELVFYCPENPGYASKFFLTVSDEAEKAEPVTVTGRILPDKDSTEEEIWQIMQQPSVVVDIGEKSHQKVYEAPSLDSPSLGTLHGQSQALEVLEIQGDWAYISAWQHEDGGQVKGYVPAGRLKTVRPNGSYGLLIDKRTQTMQVYRDGHVMAELPVSTGLPAKNRLIRETAAGAFLTGRHLDDFSDGGFHYALPIRYDGGNLLHSAGYRARSGMYDYTEQAAALGEKASHGCVRIPPYPVEEGGISVWYLWTHLPYHTRVLILDDPEIRTVQAQAARRGEAIVQSTLARQKEQTDASEEDASGDAAEDMTESTSEDIWEDFLPDLPTERAEIVLTFGGDVVLGTRESWMAREDALPAILKEKGFDWPFGALQDLFAGDDMTMVNLECVLKADSEGEKKDRPFRFRGLPAYTRVLREASVEQVNLANNHYVDYGEAGKKATREALDEAGIPFSGYGYTYILEKDGYRVGFCGIRETIFHQDRTQIRREIRELRDRGCDVVICTCHWGTEYETGHNEMQEEMAEYIMESGADLIIGGHPHVVQGVGTVLGRPVLYSLGNLMFGGTIELMTFDGLIARVKLVFEDLTYAGCEIRLIPVLTSSASEEGINDCRPRAAEGEDMERILSQIQADSPYSVDGPMWFPFTSLP